MAVYQTIRYVSTIGPFTYTFPALTPGASYKVRMHFATFSDGAAGRRAINVSVNGVSVLSNLDVYALAGGDNKALVQEVVGTADSGGNLAIAFTGDASKTYINPFVSGLEIQSSGQTLSSYDANGNRLLATTAGGNTLLPGTIRTGW